MSVNRVNESTGELVTLSSGVRCWIGTKAAHTIAVANHTMPANCLVCITDDYKNKDDYSTEETDTGKHWIDGKPIYRKVYPITTGDTLYTQVTVATLDLTVDTVVNYYGELYVTASSGYFVSQLNDINWNNDSPVPLTRTNIRKLTGQSNYTCIVSVFDNGRLSQPGIIIVEYTKTTD